MGCEENDLSPTIFLNCVCFCGMVFRKVVWVASMLDGAGMGDVFTPKDSMTIKMKPRPESRSISAPPPADRNRSA